MNHVRVLLSRLVAAITVDGPAADTLVDQAVVSLTSFLTGVIVGRTCSKEQFGVYVLALIVHYGLSELQTNLITAPYTVYHPRLDGVQARQFRGVSLVFQLAFSLAAMTVLFLVAGLLAHVPVVPAHLPGALRTLALVGVFLLAREYVRRLCFAALRIREALALDVAVGGAQIGALLVLAAAGHLSATSALATTGGAAALGTLAWLLWKRAEFGFAGNGLATARLIWSLGRWMSANALVQIGVGQAYPWMITSLAGPQSMALLAASGSVTTVANPALTALHNYVGPAAARAYALDGVRGLRRLVLNVSTGFVAVAAPFCLAVVLLGERVVILVYGPGYANTGVLVGLCTLQLIPTGLSGVASRALAVLERADVDLRISVVLVTAAIAASLWLIPRYGVEGAMAASLAGNAVATAARCWAFNRLCRKTAARLGAAA